MRSQGTSQGPSGRRRRGTLLLQAIATAAVTLALLTPVDADNTFITCSWAFPPAALERPDFDASYAVDFWDITNKQDWTICADQQLGVSSRAYVPGPFSRVRERNVAHFLDWYLGELRA